MDRSQLGLVLVAIGVLVVVLGGAAGGDNAVWFSVPGAIVTVIGAVMTYQARRGSS